MVGAAAIWAERARPLLNWTSWKSHGGWGIPCWSDGEGIPSMGFVKLMLPVDLFMIVCGGDVVLGKMWQRMD
jgi:hypothetical protein